MLSIDIQMKLQMTENASRPKITNRPKFSTTIAGPTLLCLPDSIILLNPQIHSPLIVANGFHSHGADLFVQKTKKFFSNPPTFVSVT
jgi:hypothetical protein